MKAYEGVFIFPPEAAGDGHKTQLKSLEDLIAKFQGAVVQKNEWGKRPLGYPLRKFREGYFVVVDFEMPTSQAVEFRKGLELQEDIMKYMNTTKKEAKPEKKPAVKAPAAVSTAPGKTYKTFAAPAGPAGATA